MLEFKPYSREETRGILQHRVELAFVPKVWQTNAFEKIVDKTYDLKDLRSGLYLLHEAGLGAEEKSLRVIDEKSVQVPSSLTLIRATISRMIKY